MPSRQLSAIWQTSRSTPAACRVPGKFPASALKAWRFAALLLLGGCVSAEPGRQTYSLHLDPNGRELVVSGAMTPGVTDAVKQMLDANPTVFLIRLNSPGGKIVEGYKLALLIKERHLATYTSTGCASACTIAYIAGAPRYMAGNARLGFHSSSINGESSANGNDAMRHLYEEAGIPDAFAERAIHTAPESIWFPTTSELTTAHVVDYFVDARTFPPQVMTYWASTSDLDARLRHDPAIDVIAKEDPQNYQKLRDIFLNGAKAGRGIGQIMAEAADFVSNSLMPAYIRNAPDERLLQYQQAELSVVVYLAKNAPDACAASLFPKNSIVSNPSERNLPPEIQATLNKALADLIKAALAHPQAGRDDAADRQALADFRRNLPTKAPALTSTMNTLKQRKGQPGEYCQVMQQFFELIMREPPATAAAIDRALLIKPS